MQNRENPYGANDLNWLFTVLIVGGLFVIFFKLFQ
jgi:hypothetical protein